MVVIDYLTANRWGGWRGIASVQNVYHRTISGKYNTDFHMLTVFVSNYLGISYV